jgi:uncharacterized protein (DUF4415 family)
MDMSRKKSVSRRKSVDPDDAPALTKEWFATADFYREGKLVRRGRPKSAAPKQATNLRLDPDVLKHYRATGAGWQSRINQALRKAARLGKRPT